MLFTARYWDAAVWTLELDMRGRKATSLQLPGFWIVGSNCSTSLTM
jgi:hypothetical protein